jgi:hypothetical protein
MYHVIVSPFVSQRVGALLQNRLAVIDVFNTLRDDLEEDADRFRDDRDPYNPDYFFYQIGYFSNGTWHNFDFAVNDTRETGYLFVDGVT